MRTLLLVCALLLTGCAQESTPPPQAETPSQAPVAMQPASDLIAGEYMAIAYSGFREGQHPDRGEGANNPSDDEILEDLQILLEAELDLIRLYDTGENSIRVLEIIEENDLPIKALLGIWLRAELSNHEGCPWLDEPIPDEELAANLLLNAAEIKRGIDLANQYPDIVVSVNVGNEALVEWNDHMITVESAIGYVRQVKAAIEQPVTVADNYEWWAQDGFELGQVVDYIGIHTYPAWENKTIDEAMDYTIENIERVRNAIPGKPIAILEAGWATTALEFPEQASESNQKRYYEEMDAWARKENVTVFFFEAFDEPWKGNPLNADGAEKHWGIYFVDRTPKLLMQD